MQCLRQAAKIGEARRKADHVDPVIGRGMERDQLFETHVLHVDKGCEIERVITLKADGQVEMPSGDFPTLRKMLGPFVKQRRKRAAANAGWIVID